MARTNIVLDSELVKEAMALTGAKSQREVVDIALRRLVDRKKAYQAILAAEDLGPWEGDLDALRRDRT